MEWKKVIESNDLIVFEKDFGSHKLKIEARKSREYGWEVFVTKIEGEKSNLVSEYVLDDKKSVNNLVEKIKSNKYPRLHRKSEIRTTLKRVYKEDFVEKWHFFIGDKKIKNFIIVKFDTNIKADVVMHEKYRSYENKILSEIEDKLGLDDLGETISYEIYYFSKKSKKSKKNEYSLDFIDIEFNFDNEED